MGWWGKNLPQKVELPVAASTRKVMIASPKPGAAFLQAKLEQESREVRKSSSDAKHTLQNIMYKS